VVADLRCLAAVPISIPVVDCGFARQVLRLNAAIVGYVVGAQLREKLVISPLTATSQPLFQKQLAP
jgi:hypothetical protein